MLRQLGRIDLERVRSRRDADGDLHLLSVNSRLDGLIIPGLDGRQAVHRDLPVAVRGLRVRRQAGKVAGIREGHFGPGQGGAVGFQREDDFFRPVLRQPVRTGFEGVGRHDGHFHLARFFAVHAGFNGGGVLLGCRHLRRYPTAFILCGVGMPCFPVKHKTYAGQRDFRALRNGNPSLRQRENDFGFLVLCQFFRVSGQGIFAGRHGKRNILALSSRFYCDDLFRGIGQRGKAKGDGSIASGCFRHVPRKLPNGRIALEGYFKPGLRHSVAGEGECHLFRLPLFQLRGRCLHVQCGIGGDIDGKTLFVFPGADIQGHRPGKGAVHQHRKAAVTVRDAGRVRQLHAVRPDMRRLSCPCPAEAIAHAEGEYVDTVGNRAEIFDTSGVFGPVFQNDSVFAVYKLMPGAGHGAQFRHPVVAGLVFPRHAETVGELEAELRIRPAVFGAALVHEGRQHGDGGVLHAV